MFSPWAMPTLTEREGSPSVGAFSSRLIPSILVRMRGSYSVVAWTISTTNSSPPMRQT